jgi:hypothetical protein
MPDQLFSSIPAFPYDFSMSYSKKTQSAAVKGCAGCIPFHQQQYGRAGFIQYHSQQNGRAGCTPFLNAGMSDCPASSQAGMVPE